MSQAAHWNQWLSEICSPRKLQCNAVHNNDFLAPVVTDGWGSVRLNLAEELGVECELAVHRKAGSGQVEFRPVGPGSEQWGAI
jgi:hypothetical protein